MRVLGRVMAGVLLASCFAAAAVAQPPLEAFGGLPEVEDASLSPDGERIALLMNQGDQRIFSIYNVATGELSGGVNASNIKARGVGWANDRFALLWASETTRSAYFRSRYEFGGVLAYDTQEQEIQQLLVDSRDLGPNSSTGVIDAVLAGEDAVLMPAYDATFARSLWRVDLATGRGRIEEEGTSNTRQFVASGDGRVFARIDHRDESDRFRIFARRGLSWEAIYDEEAAIAPISVVGLNEDRSALIFADYGERDTWGLYEMSLADGAISGPIIFSEDGDVVSTLSSVRDNIVIGAGFAGVGGIEYDFFDPVLDGYWQAALASFPADALTPLSWSDDLTKWLVYVAGGSTAGQYILFDFATSSAKVIAQARPAIAADSIASVLTIQYEAEDGQTISGLLTIPPGAEPSNLPTVVLPHGGPASFDSFSWDWLAQFLANEGYAVLQPNYRGSSGFGQTFEDAGSGEWGRAVLNDVTDGVEAMIASGYTDASRVCIVGASFGGYLALAGATSTPDLYRCVVAIAGVSDVARMLSSERQAYGGDSQTVAYWTEVMRGEDSETRLNDISPARFAENAQAPILLIHGRDDTVVEIEQSRIMERALRRADKAVELVVLDGEDHWLSSAETRIAALSALDGFLQEHLGAE